MILYDKTLSSGKKKNEFIDFVHIIHRLRSTSLNLYRKCFLWKWISSVKVICKKVKKSSSVLMFKQLTRNQFLLQTKIFMNYYYYFYYYYLFLFVCFPAKLDWCDSDSSNFDCKKWQHYLSWLADKMQIDNDSLEKFIIYIEASYEKLQFSILSVQIFLYYIRK